MKPTCDGQLEELMTVYTVKLATIQRLALHKDLLKHSALINNPHLLRDLCPRESPIGSSLCGTPRQWQTRISRASPKTLAWSSSSFIAQPMYNYISYPLLSPVHCENDHFDRVLRAPLQLCQLLEIVPRERVFTTLLIIVLLLCKVLPSVKLFTIFASVDKTKQENQKKYFHCFQRSLFKLITSCLLLLECFFLPSLVKYYITECHLKQAIFFLNHGAACNQRLKLKKWSQVGMCQVPGSENNSGKEAPGSGIATQVAPCLPLRHPARVRPSEFLVCRNTFQTQKTFLLNMQGLAVIFFGISMRKMLLATLIGNLNWATSTLSRINIKKVQIAMRFVIFMCHVTSPKIDFLVFG